VQLDHVQPRGRGGGADLPDRGVDEDADAQEGSSANRAAAASTVIDRLPPGARIAPPYAAPEAAALSASERRVRPQILTRGVDINGAGEISAGR
jgi:hypothetical protein